MLRLSVGVGVIDVYFEMVLSESETKGVVAPVFDIKHLIQSRIDLFRGAHQRLSFPVFSLSFDLVTESLIYYLCLNCLIIFVGVSSYYLDCLFFDGDKLTFVQKDMPLLELSSQQVRKHNN